MLDFKLLITGCARSGTRYSARQFSKTGFRLGHEGMGKDGGVCSFMAVDDYWYAGLYRGLKGGEIVRRRRMNFEHIWHQVRDPKNVIDSLLTGSMDRMIWYFTEKHVRMNLFDMPPCEREAWYWIRWNEIVEPQAEWRFKIEEFDALWDEMHDRLGIERVPIMSPEKIQRYLGKQTAERYGFEWHMLKPETEDLVKSMARKYGYDY